MLTFNAFGLIIQRPSFAAESLSGSVDPNIHGLNFVPLREVHVLLLHSFAEGGAGRCGHFSCYYNTPGDDRRAHQGQCVRTIEQRARLA